MITEPNSTDHRKQKFRNDDGDDDEDDYEIET